ncbi:MAG: MoaD/ThiS family protein [Dethiobacter sp.]|jgi:sulfur carrier protein|nr:MoaD/ThiS family protein [Dethiobacter sp.]MBS3989346.1 MoaD/ThiS family protein [Dethiobacter sp.]
MLKITVKLFATLRHNRFKVAEHEYFAAPTILAVAEELKIPREELALTMVNGVLVPVEHLLQDGDTLSIFPPVGGG